MEVVTINNKDEFDTLKSLLRKKKLNYNEFNKLIGNYFVKDYEALDENYYLVKIINNLVPGKDYYTDYIEIIN